jgi:hypothetical protein
MNSAKENRGCDRHLLGLMLISKELGLDMPKIFMDTAWKKRYFVKYLFIFKILIIAETIVLSKFIHE